MSFTDAEIDATMAVHQKMLRDLETLKPFHAHAALVATAVSVLSVESGQSVVAIIESILLGVTKRRRERNDTANAMPEAKLPPARHRKSSYEPEPGPHSDRKPREAFRLGNVFRGSLIGPSLRIA